MISPTPDIEGAQAVSDQFGRWPSFHDAEILDFHIVRGGESSVTIELKGMPGACVVIFTLRGVVDLDVGGEMVDHQNVIFDLHVEKVEGGTKLTFAPCYGFQGNLTAEHVGVRLLPSDESRQLTTSHPLTQRNA